MEPCRLGLISVWNLLYPQPEKAYLSLGEGKKEQEECLDLPVEREPVGVYDVSAGELLDRGFDR